MGRKVVKDKPKQGPGRKAKKQPAPSLPKYLEQPAKPKKLSSHQKKRLKKALEKEQAKKDTKKAAKLPPKQIRRSIVKQGTVTLK